MTIDADGRRAINPALQQHGIAVLRDTHGRTSHLSAADVAALSAYVLSLE